LKPTKEQIHVLESWCHTNRFVWNHFLAANKTKYETEKKFIFYHEMSATMTKLKNEHVFLKEPSAYSLQSICQRLESSIKKIWQINSGFPHFKSKKNGDMPSIQISQSGSRIKWNKKQINLPKIGWISWIKHCPLKGKLISTTTKYDGGHWWTIVLVETNKQKQPIGDNVVGIDLGLKDWVVTSDGEIYDIHPSLIEREKKVIKEQKILSKKTKESKNRTKQKTILQKAHYKVRCARKDNAHKVSTAIAKQYSCVAIENLNIKGMMKNRHLARKIAQVSWGQLKTYLTYKTNVKLVDRWYPSTKTCSGCGNIQKIPLNIRTYECNSCGLSINRDLNAAINIRNTTFGTKESYACGDTSIGLDTMVSGRYVSLKQEKFETNDIF
jgi:putative transposase